MCKDERCLKTILLEFTVKLLFLFVSLRNNTVLKKLSQVDIYFSSISLLWFVNIQFPTSCVCFLALRLCCCSRCVSVCVLFLHPSDHRCVRIQYEEIPQHNTQKRIMIIQNAQSFMDFSHFYHSFFNLLWLQLEIRGIHLNVHKSLQCDNLGEITWAHRDKWRRKKNWRYTHTLSWQMPKVYI